MVGALTLKSSGLILAETAETYPNGWAAATNDFGSAGLVTPGHSGSSAFQLVDTLSTLTGAYMKLTKSVDLQTAASRRARIFRALGILETFRLTDDFLGTSLDLTTWTVVGGITIANSLATFSTNTTLAPIFPSKEPPANAYYNTEFWCALDTPNGAATFQVFHTATNNDISLYFNSRGAPYIGHIALDVNSPSGETIVDLGPVPSGQQKYKVTWKAGQVVVYLNGNIIGTASTNVPAPDAVNAPTIKIISSFGGGTGFLYLDYYHYGGAFGATWNASVALGTQTLLDSDTTTGSGVIDNGFYDTGWVALTPTGVQTVELKLRLASGGGVQYPGTATAIFDDFVIMLDTTIITISALLAGMKVELYDLSNVLRGSVIAPVTNQDVTISITGLITTAFGFSGYFKVYDVDGTTLIATTGTFAVWGGDVYQWVPNTTNITTTSDFTQIYRAGSGLTPASAVVTATLTNAATGLAISGLTVTLAAVLGTTSPTSGVTDLNGKVTTTYTPGSSGGLGGVRADWVGSATYAASRGQQIIDIYYGAIVVDATKDFQVFIEGQEAVISSGDYTLSSDFQPQPFTVVTPVLAINAGGWWYVEIYRKGIKEFSGRIQRRNRVGGPNPQLTLSGVDEKIMLQRRVANRIYNDDPKNIISDLLTRYPCSITAGSLSLYGASILLTATYENLFDALKQIANLTGWVFRLNSTRTLDFASTFGTARSITIVTGGTEVTAMHDEDWSRIDTTVYVIGSQAAAALIGTATDTTAVLNFGLIEEAFLEKALTTQGTVNLRAQALISDKKSVREAITVNSIDTLATGSYVPFDTVTVTDSDLNLSGTYAILSIRRDLSDANLAALTLTQRLYTIADALQLVQATVKDLGVL